MQSIIAFLGRSAWSDFRLAATLKSLRQVSPTVDQIECRETYLAQLERPLTEAQSAIVCDLLDAEQVAAGERGALAKLAMLVGPRVGTTSPWSTKATDIAHHCGLSPIKRLERMTAWTIHHTGSTDRATATEVLSPYLHDPMTESVFADINQAERLFQTPNPAGLQHIEVMSQGRDALVAANVERGLALSSAEIDYLAENFLDLERNPTDVELMMFAQANSEHCRHKIFNAQWQIDGQPITESLFAMIRNTHALSPGRVLSAYTDNSAVTTGYEGERLITNADSRKYSFVQERIDIVMKVETHNHPTAISPFSGAATGSGGEIRDEGATGVGAKPKAGLTGFSVSSLNIPNFKQPWEPEYGKPARIASALEIMLDGPIGAASFNNEFGRPAITGYFRTYEQLDANGIMRGYHKPIMLAGGCGNIRPQHTQKRDFHASSLVIVIGGPAMLLGLGGGAASSVSSGASAEALDFASVQRSNPEMERRCQEVIDQCWSLGERNPILSIHDVGAGGLSNAIPELLDASRVGGQINLREIPSVDSGMSPLELWCNEAQERYMLAIAAAELELFAGACARERCPYAVLGTATEERALVVTDPLHNENSIEVPMQVLLGKPPGLTFDVRRKPQPRSAFDHSGLQLEEVVTRVLQLPAVADKRFLITIGDRTVGGLVHRDQMVGPWQIPVADCAVTANSFHGYTGEAMAIGERAPLAVIDAAASARIAIGEAITNIAAARIMQLGDVVLSANWMVACGNESEDLALFDAVKAVGMELCPALGIAIPVGKDSLSMETVWDQQGQQRRVMSPMSLVVSAFAPVVDLRLSLTPQLHNEPDTELVLIDLGHQQNRLGGSALAQVHGELGDSTPDLERPAELAHFFAAVQLLNEAGHLLAYHDRSDGGLFVTVCEMALAGRVGVDIATDSLSNDDDLAALFNEELGAVLQIRTAHFDNLLAAFSATPDLIPHIHRIGRVNSTRKLSVTRAEQTLYAADLTTIQRLWSQTSFRMQALRDNPICAEQELESVLNFDDPGLQVEPSFELTAPPTVATHRPAVAVLREQGVNGHTEMAAAFDKAGFDSIDVHMSDLLSGQVLLDEFHGLVACGGFSFGDVLGAGGGWAKSILYHRRLRDAFEMFFNRNDTFALGVCNGCQMLSLLKPLIPGAEHWPKFLRNRSEQFEARLAMVEVLPSTSILLRDMAGSRLPIAVAHGEGRAVFDAGVNPSRLTEDSLVSLRYVDNFGFATETYPANPNGSVLGITGLTTADGRVTIMMPHPERVFRVAQHSWWPTQRRGDDAPWLRLFQNARSWL